MVKAAILLLMARPQVSPAPRRPGGGLDVSKSPGLLTNTIVLDVNVGT